MTKCDIIHQETIRTSELVLGSIITFLVPIVRKFQLGSRMRHVPVIVDKPARQEKN